jgi:hypothetical protein
MDTGVSGGITYCVPQRIRFSALADKLDIFMRVDKVYQEASVVIVNSGKELARFSKKNLTPGEMIKQSVKKSIFEGAQGNIEIKLEAGGNK